MRSRIPAVVKTALGLWVLVLTLGLGAPDAALAATCKAQCGLGCPTGCYASSTSSDLSCKGSNIKTTCANPAGPALSTCEDRCPDGYFPASVRSNVSSCQVGYRGIQTQCQQVSGDSLNTCADSCPAGYFPASISFNPGSCGSPYSGFQTRCEKVSGTELRTCEDACPTGYYPERTFSNVSSCGGRYRSIQTVCAQVSGTSLETCGTACPTGYLTDRTRTSVSACQTRYSGIQTVCKKEGSNARPCDETCPAGQFVSGTQADSSCVGGVRTICSQISGNSLRTCEDRCPDGYYTNQLFSSVGQCSLRYNGFQIECNKVAGADLRTCEDACPTGYYPSRTLSPVFSCGGRYKNIQTECDQVSGTSLDTCGTACPTGYLVDRTRTSVSACETRYLGIETRCVKEGNNATPCDETCPAGQYVSGTNADSSCVGGVRTQCSQVSGNTLRTCEERCPAGYYATSLFSNVSQCGLRYNGVQIECTKLSGDFLRTCEDACPDGFHVTATDSGVFQCGGRYRNLQTECAKDAGDRFDTCQDKCPAGYYPTGTSSAVARCSVRYRGIETECSKVQDNTLASCGDTCPAGYFPGDITTNFRCGDVYFNQQIACDKTPSGSAPRILVHPQAVSIVEGQSARLSVSASGQAPLFYQWYLGASGDRSKPVAGATSAAVNVSPTTTTSYWVLVSNSHGDDASNTVTVTVTPRCIPPAITAQPQSASVNAGQSATLGVTATGTSLSYQWYRGSAPDTSNPVPGGTTASISVTPASTSSYWVRVLNDCGTADSGSATVTVIPPCVAPVITSQPRSITITEGDSTTISVAASGTDLTYQWYLGNAGDTSRPVQGGTSASIRVAPSSSARYWARVSNSCGSADSGTAVVTVEPRCVAPAFLSQPQPATITAGQSATLSASATGTSVSYQWYEGASPDLSRPVPGATGGSVVVSPTSTTSYWVRIFNACGTADSGSAQVTVNPACIPPSINRQPSSLAITAGETATLAVAAAGSSLRYQWFEGAASDTSRPVSGGFGPSITVSPSSTTSYWARVSNECGTVDSGTASVTVSPACVAPGILAQPQPAAINAGQAVSLSVTASGTSLSYQWYRGTSGDTSDPVPSGTASAVAVAPSSTTGYWVRISNDCGSIDSHTAVVTVTPVCVSPAFTAEPQSATIEPGQSATLSAAASGTAPRFQWYQGFSGDTSNPVPGGVGASLVVSPVATTNYWVRAFNDCGLVDSRTATVTVAASCVAPRLTSQPSSVTITAGESATLSVSATGTSLHHQWYQGFTGDISRPVPGGTGPSLTVSPSATTRYWVQITNDCGSTGSVAATVTVQPACVPPGITAHPQSVNIDAGQSAVLSVGATGTDLFFQWYEGSSGDTSNPVPGGFGQTLVVSPSATTSYWAQAFNDCGQANSFTATVTVNVGCGPDGTPCSADGNFTCQGGQCVCSNCASAVCCGTPGNTFCDGQQYFDPNTGYNGACASSLGSCGRFNDFNGDDEVFHQGDIRACVKYNGEYQWFPRRPSPRCQEVSPVCGYVCALNTNGGAGFMCEENGFWSQNPPLPYCYGGTVPAEFLCQ